MVSEESVREQLKRIDFKQYGWGKAEVNELPHILLDGEEIFEAVNGTYDNGFALLLATDVRLLLVDKKPFNYLTVEDLRFDMINEIDYSHRMFGANISISTGSKNLRFRSYNQPRLRKLIGHVQDCMAEAKKKQSNHQEDQNQHLEQINQQLQAYLVAQYQHQEELQRHLTTQSQQNSNFVVPPEPKPSPELSDYLFAQSLLAQHQAQVQTDQPGQFAPLALPTQPPAPAPAPMVSQVSPPGSLQPDDLYAEGVREIYGKRQQQPVALNNDADTAAGNDAAMRIIYSKLPMVLRSRKFAKFGRRPPAPIGIR
jgi:chromatin segregation and condensation protein Rec8/ScpA/Scc1 (kleisin family)